MAGLAGRSALIRPSELRCQGWLPNPYSKDCPTPFPMRATVRPREADTQVLDNPQGGNRGDVLMPLIVDHAPIHG